MPRGAGRHVGVKRAACTATVIQGKVLLRAERPTSGMGPTEPMWVLHQAYKRELCWSPPLELAEQWEL